MICAVSDIHGCYDKYKELLKRISLDDTLYVLGDVIDRGPDGFKIMLDMVRRPNVVNLMGNHEAMALSALSRMLTAMEKGGGIEFAGDAAKAVKLWFYNGGELSLADFLWLDEEQEQIVWEYMRGMPLYKEVEAGGRQFVLVHGGLENFSLSRPLSDYTPDEILWCRPEEDTVYYLNKYIRPLTKFGPPTDLMCPVRARCRRLLRRFSNPPALRTPFAMRSLSAVTATRSPRLPAA